MSVEIPESLRICPGCFSEDENGIQFACLMSGPEELCGDCAATVNRIQDAETFAVVPQVRNRFVEGVICGMVFIAAIEALCRLL